MLSALILLSAFVASHTSSFCSLFSINEASVQSDNSNMGFVCKPSLPPQAEDLEGLTLACISLLPEFFLDQFLEHPSHSLMNFFLQIFSRFASRPIDQYYREMPVTLIE